MLGAGALNDPEGWYGEGGGRGVQAGNFVGRIQGAKGPFDLQFLTWDFS